MLKTRAGDIIGTDDRDILLTRREAAEYLRKSGEVCATPFAACARPRVSMAGTRRDHGAPSDSRHSSADRKDRRPMVVLCFLRLRCRRLADADLDRPEAAGPSATSSSPPCASR
jgi:hypothetical protein